MTDTSTNSSNSNSNSNANNTVDSNSEQKTNAEEVTEVSPGTGTASYALSSKKSLRCYLEINLKTFRNNVKIIQKTATKTACDVIAVIKANAYGHGSVRMAQECVQLGINAFAVATVMEGVQLRLEAGLQSKDSIRVIVLGASVPGEYPLYVQHSLDMLLSSPAMVESLLLWSKTPLTQNDDNSESTVVVSDQRIDVHCMMDTGMTRIGFQVDECLKGIRDIHALQSQRRQQLQQQSESESPSASAPASAVDINFVGLCTHMADALNSEYTLLQFERFTSVLTKLDTESNINVAMFHCENSTSLMADVINDSVIQSYMDRDTNGFVRIGSALYGYGPQSLGLHTCLSLKAQIRHIAITKKGTSVGYGRSWIAAEDCLIATLSIGYADGYPRSMSNKEKCVYIGSGHKKVYGIAGKVCMDMLMVNLGSIESGDGNGVNVGDYAVLFGNKNENELYVDPAQIVSEFLGGYNGVLEITCGFTQRVGRIFIN